MNKLSYSEVWEATDSAVWSLEVRQVQGQFEKSSGANRKD